MTRRHIMTMHPRHHASLVAGSKRSTVRWSEGVELGSMLFVFDLAEYPPLRGCVESVEEHLAATLTAEAAQATPGTDMVQFVRELRANYYPEMPDDAVLQVVTFTLD